MKKIVLFAVLLLVAVGCGKTPKKVAVVEEIPVVVVPAPVPEVDNDLLAPEPIIPDEVAPVPEPEPEIIAVETETDNDLVNPEPVLVEAEEEVPPQKPQPQTPPVYREPPVRAGYVRYYWWQNGQKWYRDYPAAQQKSGANCASGDCGGSGRRAILPWRN